LIFDAVSQITNSDGLGNTQSLSYLYESGKYYFNTYLDRKFSGFNKITTTDSAGNYIVNYYHQGNTTDTSNGEYSDDISKAGKIYRTEIRDSSGNLYSLKVNKWDKYDLGSGRNFVKLVRTTNLTYDGDSDHKDTAQEFTYDNSNGNLTSQVDWGEVTASNDGSFTDTGSDKFTTSISYSTGSTVGVIGLPNTESTVDQSSAKVKETRHYYDTLSLGSVQKGNETKTEQWKSSTNYINTQKTYNSYGLVTQELDPRGKATNYSYDTYNLYPATVTNALSQATAYTYDYSLGKPKQVTDPNSRVYQTVYDGLDRVVAEKQPDLSSPSTLVNKTTYTYTDTSGAVKVQKTDYLDGSTSVDSYTYFDGLGRPIQTRQEMEDSNTFAVTDTIYNNVGQVYKKSLPYSSAGSAKTAATSTASLLETYSYDPMMRVTSTVNASGETIHTYDDWKVVVPDARGKAKNLYKDARGNLIKVEELNNTSSIGKGLNAYWKFDNNSNDELGASNGSDSSVAYATGKINQGAGYNGTSSLTAFPSSGALKPTGSFTLAGWLKTSSTSSFRTFFQSFNQDQGAPGYAAGIRAYIWDGIPGIQIGKNTGQTWGSDYVMVDATTNIGTSGNWAYYAAVYDGSTVKIYINGTQQTSVSWTGNPEYSAVTYQRAGAGNDGGFDNNFFPGSLDEMGLWSRALSASEISQLYNSGNGLAYSNFDPDIYTTQYEYDGNNNLTKITDALGNVRNFTYDGLGRRLTAQDLHASADTSYGTWTYTYDDAGNTTSVVDPKSQTINYAYDDLNRVLTENYAGATGTEVTYVYDSGTDGIGHLTSVTKLDGVNTANLYNPLGGLKQETKTIASTNYVTAYTYDRQGNQLVITSPDNSEIKYTYNTAGQLETVQRKESGGSYTDVVTDFDYSPHGQVTNTYYANGATTVNTYDAAKLYRLSSKVTTIAGGSKAQDTAYAYDSNGNVTGITDNSATNAKKTVAYVYDDLNRLTSATATNVASGQSTYTENYAYDAIGNITSKTGPGSYTYAGNTGTNYANPHAATTIGSDTYAYDNNGNLTTVSTGGGGGGSATIALDATSTSITNAYNGTITKTWSHTTSSGDNRLLVLSADLWQDTPGTGTVTSASYNGVAMTKATNIRKDGMESEIWYVVNPASGAHTLSVTVTGATDSIKLSASTFTGVDQTTPYVASNTATGESGNPSVSRTTTVANSLLVATLSRYSTTAATTNKTSLYNNATGETVGASSYQVTATTGSYSDTYTGSSATDWSMVASEFRPATAGGGGGTTSLANTWDYNNRLTQTVAGSATVSYAYDETGQRVKYANGTNTTYYPSQYYNVTGTTATKHILTPDGTMLATVETSTTGGGGGGGPATIALDATSTSITNTYNGTITKTWSHTTGSGSDRLLVLSADLWQDTPGTGTVTAASYNGVAMTKATNIRKDGMESEIWYLANPASGSHTVSVTVTGATDSIKLAASTFTGADQTTPYVASNTATGESGNPSVSRTTTVASSLLVSTLSRYGTTAATTNKTSLYNNATGSTLGAASYQVTTATGSYSDTYTGSSATDWSMVASEFRPATTEGEGGGESSTTVHYIHTDHLTGSNVVTDSSDAIEQTLDYYPYGSIRLNEKAGSFDEVRKFASMEADSDTGLSYAGQRYYNPAVARFTSQDKVFLVMGDTGQIKELTGQQLQQLLSDPQNLNSYSYSRNNPLVNIDIDGNFSISVMGLFSPRAQVAIGNWANNTAANNRAFNYVTEHKWVAYTAGGIGLAAGAAAGVLAGGAALGYTTLANIGSYCVFACNPAAQQGFKSAVDYTTTYGNSLGSKMNQVANNLEGSEYNFSDHSIMRIAQRVGPGNEKLVTDALNSKSFEYFHDNQWKIGYYDKASKLFVGTDKSTGELITIITNASQNYINNLTSKTP
jgi:RHS repeat-associated protein